MRPGYNEEGVKWSIRSEMRLARGDNAGQIEALETAIRLEPRLSSSQMALALLHEREQDYDKAIERYRAIIANDDRNVAALNNLAFALAVRKQLPKEALPLAQRAYLLTREQASTGDTLAWVYHLLGDDKTALPLLQDARGACRSTRRSAGTLAPCSPASVRSTWRCRRWRWPSA